MEELAPNGVRDQDVKVLIGITAVLDGYLMAGEMPDRIAERLRHRFVREGLLDDEAASERDLRQALSDLNHRLRYARAEYDEPPAPIPVPTSEAMTQAASPQAAKWIVDDGPVPVNVTPGVTAGALHEPPHKIDHGPKSALVSTVIESLLPLGSTLHEAYDLPDLNAAHALYMLPDGDAVRVAVRRQTRPIPLQMITAGAGQDQLSELPSGTQAVEVRRNLPQSLQLFLVRPNGISISYMVSSTNPGAAATAATDPDRFFAALKQKLDTSALDAAF